MVKSTSRRTRSNSQSRQCARAARAAAARRAGKRAKAVGQGAAKAKWVYTFGDGKAEGQRRHAQSARRQGRRASPRWPISACRCRPASPSPPRSARTTTPTARAIRTSSSAGRRRRSPQIGRITGKTFGDRRQSAAGLGALRRARVDARHDGHRAQSRPQRRDRRGAGAEVRRPALRLRLLSPLHHDVFRRGARRRASSLRGNPRRPQGPQRLHARHRSLRRRLGRAGRPLQGAASRRSTASRSRRTRTSSCGARSARCSARG